MSTTIPLDKVTTMLSELSQNISDKYSLDVKEVSLFMDALSEKRLGVNPNCAEMNEPKTKPNPNPKPKTKPNPNPNPKPKTKPESEKDNQLTPQEFEDLFKKGGPKVPELRVIAEKYGMKVNNRTTKKAIKEYLSTIV